MSSEVFGIEVNPFLLFLWSFLSGLVFSTVGAAGGILAGVGHISIFGIPYANSVKLMNQILIFTSTLISVPSYWKQRRVIFILGVLLGVGSIAGALIGSTLSYRFLPDLKSYKPLFGIFTLVVAIKIFYDTFHKKKSEKVEKGEVLYTIYADSKAKLEEAVKIAKMLKPLQIEGMLLERIPSYKK